MATLGLIDYDTATPEVQGPRYFVSGISVTLT